MNQLKVEPSLYAYQAEVLGQMAQGLPTYLGFDPGLGKSRTALEAARLRKAKRILIVCPASGRYVWQGEIRKWWPQMPFTIVTGPSDLGRMGGTGIVIMTYGLLSQKDGPYAAAVAKGSAFDMTILDEAAALKNSGANRTKAVFGKMLPKLGYVVPMSGTPAPNHAGELYTVLKACYPEALHRSVKGAPPLSEWDFQEMFCKVTSKRFGPSGRDIRVIEGSKNMNELRRRMFGFMRRVKKEDVLEDLPAIRWDIVPVKAKFDGAMPVLPNGMGDDDLIKYLSGATGEEHIMRLRRILGMAKLDGATEYIQDFLDALPANRKVLVFAHHREVIARLATDLGSFKPAVLVGSSTAFERTKAIDQFLHDPACRVFIGNIAAAGTGLTLVGPGCKCSDVIFVEATYSVGDNVQAACRVHRIGQHDAVVARMLTASGTIDDRIQDILARKANDFAQLFN